MKRLAILGATLLLTFTAATGCKQGNDPAQKPPGTPPAGQPSAAVAAELAKASPECRAFGKRMAACAGQVLVAARKTVASTKGPFAALAKTMTRRLERITGRMEPVFFVRVCQNSKPRPGCLKCVAQTPCDKLMATPGACDKLCKKRR